MVTTQGFRDVVEIGRGTRDDLWDAYKDNAEPYIRRRDRLEVTERVDHRGEVLDRASTRTRRKDVARILARREVETVAVCFVNAYANGEHEQRMAEILARGAARRDDLDLLRRPARALRARALLHHGRQRRPLAARLRLRQRARPAPEGRRLRGRPADPALRRRRDDAGGGAGARGPARRVGHRRRRRRRALHRRAVRAQERDRRRHGRHQHRHLARLRRRSCARPTSGSSSTATRSASRRSRC